MAGHGDIQDGVGFIELRDQRFCARDLEEMIASLRASRVHLILDSCNAYFMLNPRSASAPRFLVDTSDLARGLLAKHPEVGALISTSAEAVTYEWSEIQSGIFSYEVRSGFRGAADANNDGQIEYAEIEAFVSRANERIPNELYRPKVYVRGSSRDAKVAAFWSPSASAHRLRIGASGDRRLTFRDFNGSRILDLHKEEGTSVTLLLPSLDGQIQVDESVRKEDGRPGLV